MTADQLLQLVTQVLLVISFVVVAIKAIRRPWRANVDTALLFGVTSLIVAQAWIDEVTHSTPGWPITAITNTLLMSLPYLLIRLVADFTDLPPIIARIAGGGLIASAISFLILRAPYPGVLDLIYVLYFLGLTLYVAVAFVRAARRASGVTRRRMQAVAVGSCGLGLAIFVAGAAAIWPRIGIWQVLGDLLGLSCVVGYFVGFTPPRWLRRTWQEPEVRLLLQRAATLPRLPQLEAILQALEAGAAQAFGVAHATIGLWDESTGQLTYHGDGQSLPLPPDQLLGGRAFTSGQPIFSDDAPRDDPDHAARYTENNARAVLAAPISAGEKRIGVLVVYAPRAPLFADDDLELLSLLAGQAAIILESHALINEAAQVRGREEAARLKDDFLSAAAHDLKTPLTGIVAQAQLLERRVRRNPDAPADLQGIERIVTEAQRLKRLVLELLDVTRADQGMLVARREPVDLVAMVTEACERHSSTWHQCVFRVEERIQGEYDQQRILQVVENLLENAIKYSPDGGEVLVTLWREGAMAHLTVTDRGIGIPEGDLPHLFDRFHRGSNVDDRRFAGLGLGLFICRGIVEQHGGRISATSRGAGHGSTFHVVLPCTPHTEMDAAQHEASRMLVAAEGPNADGRTSGDGNSQSLAGGLLP